MARPSVLLLLGAPGAGKSLLGQALVAGRPGCSFLSIGEEVRKAGLVDEVQERPTAAKRHDIKQRARALLETACSDLHGSTEPALPPASRVLVLECVKEVEDAFVLLEVLDQFKLPLTQVLLLPTNSKLLSALKQQALIKKLWTYDSQRRDKERRVQERQAKWEANAAQLIELFSSLGLLTEVTVAVQTLPTQVPAPAQLHGRHSLESFQSRARRQQEEALARESRAAAAASLASLGYAAGPTSSLSLWLHESGLTPLPGLTLTPIQPVVSRRLVVQRKERDQVLTEAAASSGLKGILGPGGRLPVPTAAVSSVQQATWLAHPGRYCVSRKCDGVRHLLIVAANGTAYLKNRAGSLYHYPVELAGSTATALPPGTILDGELVWVGGRGFFLVFDALALGSQHRAWQLLLKARLQLLAEQLHLVEAESCSALIQAAASGQAAAPSNTQPAPRTSLSPSAPAPAHHLHKKQQAPANDSITVLFKQQHDVSSQTLQQLEASREACPYPSDGLIFTPCDMPYALGMQELMFKWQPWQLAAVDLSRNRTQEGASSALQSLEGFPCELPYGLVYECLPSSEKGGWRPVSIRWDKAHGNAQTFVRQMQMARTLPMLQGPEALQCAVAAAASAPPVLAAASAAAVHPARSQPFPALYSAVMAAVAGGTVERTQAEDGLEVFNYTAAALAADQGEAEQICRGLVLHPATCTVVATPFVRFQLFQHPSSCLVCGCSRELDEAGDRLCWCDLCKRSGCCFPEDDPPDSGPRKLRKVAATQDASSPSLQPADPFSSPFMQPADPPSSPSLQPAESPSSSEDLVSASVKVDGSLVIAFLWEGQLRVATRRRL